MFYLVRHGKTDYREKNTKIYKGFGTNLAPLSSVGIQQLKTTAKDERLMDADIIICSPYTRALQSAAILSKELQIDIAVETDLHEWVANKNYIFRDDDIAEENYKEFLDSDGVYRNEEKEWEDNSILSNRILSVLEKYKGYKKVIVVCHGMIIRSISKGDYLNNGEIFEYDLD